MLLLSFIILNISVTDKLSSIIFVKLLSLDKLSQIEIHISSIYLLILLIKFTLELFIQ